MSCLSFVCSLLLLHKTTWREYFDALSFLRCERWLCAPFFLFSLLFLHHECLNSINYFAIALTTTFVRVQTVKCVFLHKTTWREYLMLWVSEVERDDCVLRFLFFSSSFKKVILRETCNLVFWDTFKNIPVWLACLIIWAYFCIRQHDVNIWCSEFLDV